MNNAAKVRQVYHELRKTVAEDATASEVLQHAHSLVKLFSDEVVAPECSLRTGGVAIENQALDVAFADGGWRIFQYEMNHNRSYYSGEDWDGVSPDLLEGYVDWEQYLCQM